MKKIYLFLTTIILFTSNVFAQPNLEWVDVIGGVNDDDIGRSITVDNFGNVYTVGSFSGTVDFDPGPGVSTLTSNSTWNAFILKVDAAGNFLWAKKIDGEGNTGNGLSAAYDITLDNNGNIYVTGFYSGNQDFDPGVGIFAMASVGSFDCFVLKLDASGNFVWAKSWGSTTYLDYSESIKVDANGNVYTTGRFYNTVDFDPGPGTFNLTSSGDYDIFVSKLDANGDFLWAKSVGASEWDDAKSIALDALGNCYITGYFRTTVDFDPGPGVVNLTSLGAYDMYILKLDVSGNFVWVKHIAGIGQEQGWDIFIDGTGNIFTTGRYSETVDFDPGAGIFNLTNPGMAIFVLKLDINGDFVWAKDMPSGGCCSGWGRSIKTDIAGNIYIAGMFNQTTDFDPGIGTFNLTPFGGYDNFVCKLDGNGDFLWAVQTGGTLAEETFSLALDGANNIYTTGTYNGTADFDPGTGTLNHTSVGNEDIFIHKMGQCSSPAQPSAITGSTTLCEGAIETYSVTNDAAATSYTWTLPSGWSGSSTTNSITATAGTSSGTITVTANNTCGSSTTQNLTVTVNPLPTIVATGDATICDGDATTLTATGASSYAWNNGAGTGASVSVSPTSTTTYTVTGTDANSCSNTAQVTVTVNPLPTVVATGTATICDGDATTLTVTGASSYAWDNGAGTGASVSVSPTATTTYTVTGTDANSCSNTAQVTVTVNPLPTVVYTQTPNIVCENDAPFALTGGFPSGGVYSGTGVSAGSFDPALAGAGTYTITYSFTDGNNCSNSDTQQIQVDVCAGIDEQATQLVTIYPNPFKNEFTVSFTNSGNHTVELFNVLGEQLKLINVYEQNTVINTDDLPSGVYFLRIVDEKLIFKLLKN